MQVIDLISCICQRNITILFHSGVKILVRLELFLDKKLSSLTKNIIVRKNEKPFHRIIVVCI